MVTNSNFLTGFCRIPLPLPAQLSLSNSKEQVKFHPRKQTKESYSLQRELKRRKTLEQMTLLPKSMFHKQSVKSQQYPETSAGFSQLPGH